MHLSKNNLNLLQTNRNAKVKTFLFSASILWITSIIVICVRKLRPVQDDYAILGLVSRLGIKGMLEDSWLTHGGNLFPMFVNAIAVIPSQTEFNFFGISVLAITTLLLIFGAFMSILDIYFHEELASLDFAQLFFICAAFTLCFESAFTPQLAEVLTFSSASLVHLWPVCFFFIGLRLAVNDQVISSILIFFLGAIAGNCNIAESIFISSSLIFLICAKSCKWKFAVCLLRLKINNLIYFLIGNLVGMLTIIVSPGFWDRASSQTANGVPKDFNEFGYRFLESLLIFTADILSHPGFFLFILLGFFLSRYPSIRSKLRVVFPTMALFELLLFLTLVLGATFAYPAWHQSIALYILLPCIGLGLPSMFPQINFLNLRVIKSIAFLLISIVVLCNLRGLYLINERGTQWDLNSKANYCVAINLSNNNFLGAEIRYQPFGLGIEDISRWDWMANAFRDWVRSDSFIPKSDC